MGRVALERGTSLKVSRRRLSEFTIFIMPRIDLTEPAWSGLLDDPEDIMQLLACRIVPGQTTSGRLRNMREYLFHVIEYNKMYSFVATDGFYDSCGQDVLLLIYEKRFKKGFFDKERPMLYHRYCVAVIGVNREVRTDPDYLFWDGLKKRVPVARKELLARLVLLYKDSLHNFAHHFTAGMGQSEALVPKYEPSYDDGLL